jgi:flavin-dependent dehydrogenase
MRRTAIDCGAEWHDGRGVTEVARKNGGWEMHWRQSDRSGTLKARYLVDATGRWAWLANRHGVKRVHQDRLVAFAARVPIESKTNQGVTLVEAVEHGWWYSIDLPSLGQREAVFYTDSDLPVAKLAATREGWMQLIESTTETSAGIVRGPLEHRPRVIGSRSGVLEQAAGDGWLAVGDAALTEDPLASNGLVTALKSGLEGAAVVADQLTSKSDTVGRGYSRRVSMNHEASTTLRIAYYRMERRWRSSPFWARRQQTQTYSVAAVS